jgi:hypothetical protein
MLIFFQSINFSTTVVNEALGKEKQFKNFFANVEYYLREHVRTFPDSHASFVIVIFSVCNHL